MGSVLLYSVGEAGSTRKAAFSFDFLGLIRLTKGTLRKTLYEACLNQIPTPRMNTNQDLQYQRHDLNGFSAGRRRGKAKKWIKSLGIEPRPGLLFNSGHILPVLLTYHRSGFRRRPSCHRFINVRRRIKWLTDYQRTNCIRVKIFPSFYQINIARLTYALKIRT